MTIEELKIINEKKLNDYIQKDNKSNKDINKEILIHEKIKKLLDNNPGLFFQISMEEALKILSKLVDESQLKEVYTSLIKPDKYKELRKKFLV